MDTVELLREAAKYGPPKPVVAPNLLGWCDGGWILRLRPLLRPNPGAWIAFA